MKQATRFVQGSAWAVSMRWAMRLIGLGSTLILARLLTPQDFGIVAMSSMTYGLLVMCSDMGTAQLLLRTGATDRQAYDTAWTIGLIQTIVLAIAFAFAAYPAAAYFKEPRLVEVMQVVAAGSVIGGFRNIGTVMYRRDLDFRRDFLLGLYLKILTVVSTVLFALVYRSYWALVWGPMVGGAVHVWVTYAMHPFRPRWSLAGWRSFVNYSVWVTPTNLMGYLIGKIDVALVGNIGSTAQLGLYNVAQELARMATNEVIVPMSRAIYPNYAKLKGNLKELSAAFLIVVRTSGIICFAFGFGVSAVADDLVHVVLGDQWGFAVPIMNWLAIGGAFGSMYWVLGGHIMLVLGHERSMFWSNCARLALFAVAVPLAAQTKDVEVIARTVALCAATYTTLFIFYLPRILPVSAFRIFGELARVFCAGLLMFIVVRFLHLEHVESRLVTLFVDVVVGATVFISLLGGSWLFAGRPDGPERRALQLVSGLMRRPVPRT